MRLPLWQFWSHFSNKTAIENARQAKFENEFQIARAEIVAAKIRGGNGGYHRFLTIAQRSLESGEVKPSHIIKVIKIAEEGRHSHVVLQSALDGLRRNENQPA